MSSLLASLMPSGQDMKQSIAENLGFPVDAIGENVQMSEQVVGSRSAAFDGRVVYVAGEDGLHAFDREGKARWHCRPNGWTGREKIFSSLGKLAVWDGKRTVTWYELPPSS